MTDVDGFVANALEQAEKYFETTNQILGVLSLSIGYGCLSTDNPEMYGWFSSAFILLAWRSGFESYKDRLRILRSIEHPKMTPFYVIKRCYIAMIGWAFLTAIPIGIIDKSGWVGFGG